MRNVTSKIINITVMSTTTTPIIIIIIIINQFLY